jgi:hypothetical protein
VKGVTTQDSSVGIVTGYGLNRRVRSSSPGRGNNFVVSTSSRTVLGPTEPPIQWVMVALSPGVNRPGREAEHSPPSSAEVKKTWIYTSSLPYASMAFS